MLLAGGQGRRFGSDKLLHPLADGTPVGVAAARVLAAACPRSVAVLRPEQDVLAGLLAAEGLVVVTCAASAEGMGHSLAAGVAASPEAAGWLVALADMPFLRVDSLLKILSALATGAPLVAPVHEGKRGHPVGFAARWRSDLLASTGDQGARELLTRHGALLQGVPVSDPGVVRDIDVPADLAAPLVR